MDLTGPVAQVGSAPPSQGGGRGFESPPVHLGARGSDWSERPADNREVGGSSPPGPTRWSMLKDRYIVLDTSFLMALSEKKSISLDDLFRLYPKAKLVTTKSVISEIKGHLDGKRRSQARISLEIVERYNIGIFEDYDGSADEDVLKLSKELGKGAVVVTFDLELKERLLDLGIPVIYLRAGKKLVFEDPLRLSKED